MDYHRSDIAGAENYFTRVLSNADLVETAVCARNICSVQKVHATFNIKHCLRPDSGD